mgnify:FL=1|tara:strand:+ start:659 stop:1678 length:1020 start_codon:yes stop_codon:yes gene_type:complete
MNSLNQTLPGRIAYKDLKNAEGTDFASFRVGEGVVHKGRKYIFYSDVNYGLTEDNPIRIKGSSGTKVNQISDSRRQGIDSTAELPCVSLSDDPSKTYDGENGMTRYKADRENGWNEGAWMDIVEFVSTEDRTKEYNRKIYLHRRNDGLPQDSNSVDDLVGTATKLITSKDLELDLDAVTKFVYDAAPNMLTKDKNKAIKQIVKEEDVPTSTIGWTYAECLDWLEDRCVDDYEVDYCFPYRYFAERIYAVMKKYHESKKVVKVTQWFDNKGDSDEVVLASRINQQIKWEELRLICKTWALYMLNNDWQLPVELTTAFPQIKSGDNKEPQDKLVKLCTVEK